MVTNAPPRPPIPAAGLPAAPGARWRAILFDRQLPLVLLLAPAFLVSNHLLNGAGVAGLVLLCGLRWRATGCPFPASPATRPLAGLLVMTVVGLLVSLSPDQSLSLALGTLYGAALFSSILGSVRDAPALRLLVSGMVLGTAALVPIALLGTDWTDKTLTYLPASLYDHLPRLLGGLATTSYGTTRLGFHPNEVALALAMALVLPLSLSLLPASDLRTFAGGGPARYVLSRPVLAISALFCLALIVLTQSRGTLLALIPALVGIAAGRWPAIRPRLPLLIGLSVAACGLAVLVVFGNATLYHQLIDSSGQGWGSGGRFVIWNRAVVMIADFPLTGVGLNTFPIIQPLLYPTFELHGGNWVTAHNLYLQTALDLGLPGLACLVWLLAASARAIRIPYRVTQDRVYQMLTTAVLVSILVWLVDGLADAPIRLGAKAGLWIWIALGLAFVLPALAAGAPSTRSMPPPAGDAEAEESSPLPAAPELGERIPSGVFDGPPAQRL